MSEVIEIIMALFPGTSRDALEYAYKHGHLHGKAEGIADAMRIIGGKDGK